MGACMLACVSVNMRASERASVRVSINKRARLRVICARAREHFKPAAIFKNDFF